MMRRSGHESFDQFYRCYRVDKDHNQAAGNKIILPASALDRLEDMLIEYPMMFRLSSVASEGRVSHCGVLEFTADEGTILMPSMVMKNLLLEEGALVHVKNASLCNATYVKLQPHSVDFLDVNNVKAVLEVALRNYACLTEGDTIEVAYNDNNYSINVVETRPSEAVSIIETDCEVDFATPLDYKPPAKIDEPVVPRSAKVLEPKEEEKAKFVPFGGTACRLDGQLVAGVSAPKEAKEQVMDERRSSTSKGMRFGSNNVERDVKCNGLGAAKDQLKQETARPKFEPFTGKKYTLM